MKKRWVVMVGLGLAVSLIAAAKTPQAGPSARQIQGMEKQLAAHPDDPRLLLTLGEVYHMKGAQGDKDAVKRSRALLEKLVGLEPGNAAARAWYGSVLTLCGRDAWLPIEKMRLVQKGLNEMDRAVQLAPDDVAIRLLRARNGLSLPGVFHRLDTSIGDLEHVLSLEKAHPGTVGPGTLRGVLLELGRAYGKAGDKKKARQRLEELTTRFPRSAEAAQAEKILEG